MLQDDVPAAELGTVNGVQGSACAAFEVTSFAAGLALRTPRDFNALMAASCALVALSAAVLARFAMRCAAARPRPDDGSLRTGAELQPLVAADREDAMPD